MTRNSHEDLFDLQVPRDRQEYVLQSISEAAWGAEVEGISIIDSEQLNITNIEASGTILIDGTERWFHIREGDRNGFELLGWEEGQGIERAPREPKALAPLTGQMAGHSRGAAEELLDRWDGDLDPGNPRGARISELPAKAAYDAFFAPGGGAAGSHHDAAAREGYEIVDECDAVAARKRVLASIITVAPARAVALEMREAGKDRLREILADWREAADPASRTGAKVERCRQALLGRLARITSRSRLPTGEERAAIAALGYDYCDHATARKLRRDLIRPLLELVPVAGFDPADLPENPVASLFQTLDPALVSSTRVDPEREGQRLLDGLAGQMADGWDLAIPDWATRRAAVIGFELSVMSGPAEPEEPDDSPGW